MSKSFCLPDHDILRIVNAVLLRGLHTVEVELPSDRLHWLRLVASYVCRCANVTSCVYAQHLELILTRAGFGL